MTSSLTRGKPTEKGFGRSYRWERVALASGILFVAWIGALTVAVLRSTVTGSRIASRLDGAGRASGETDEV